MELHEKIKEARLKSGKSSKDTALDLELTPILYSRIETGARKPNYETLIKIAKHFNTSLDFFLLEDVNKLDVEVYLTKFRAYLYSKIALYRAIDLYLISYHSEDDLERQIAFAYKDHATSIYDEVFREGKHLSKHFEIDTMEKLIRVANEKFNR